MKIHRFGSQFPPNYPTFFLPQKNVLESQKKNPFWILSQFFSGDGWIFEKEKKSSGEDNMKQKLVQFSEREKMLLNWILDENIVKWG